MARRKGFFAAMAQASREAERQRQAQERAQMRAIPVREQAQRAAERAHSASEREARRFYAEAREQETLAQEAELESRRSALEAVLEATLNVDDYIDLDALKQPPYIPPFDPGSLAEPAPTPDPNTYVVAPLTITQRFLPGAKGRHEQLVE